MKKCFSITFLFVTVAVGVFACGRPPEDKGNQPSPVTDVSTPDTGMPDNGTPDNGQPDAICVPDCDEKDQCSDDGCGGTCPIVVLESCDVTAKCVEGKYVGTKNPECCTQDAECDDSNQCTKDICDTVKGCVATPIVCTDVPGFVATCDPKVGCVYTEPVDCDGPDECGDKNLCTTDSCVNGKCVFAGIACDDGNACTQDACDLMDGSCVHIAKVCDDKDVCTADTCDPKTGECVYTETVCDDSNACTTDSCDKVKGCVYTEKTCNDNNPCTTDSCDKVKGCMFTGITCDDGNACTTDTCDKVKGCVSAPVNCDDGKSYTDDSCDPTGKCVHTVKTGACLKDSDCEDGDPCTEDVCDSISNQCKLVEIKCDDGNACTMDVCMPAPIGIYGYICDFQWKTCDDGNACTWDFCDEGTGACQNGDSSCDDGNACTTETCDPKNGCAYAQVDCDDFTPCTTDSCDPQTGCVYTEKTCNDNNPDTWDMCDWENGECINLPVSCDDSNECTKDTLDTADGVGQCLHEKVEGCCLTDEDCGAGYQCVNNACEPKPPQPECWTAMDCNDNSGYTEDFCVNGMCSHTDMRFAFQCSPDVKTQFPDCQCEVWAFYGMWESVDSLSCIEKKAVDFAPGTKLSAVAICNSWWKNYNDPTGAHDSATLELNARVVCADHTDWIGGEVVQVVDPAGQLVPLVELHQSAKGVGWQDAAGVWHGRNYGAQNGIPWCDANNPPPAPCE